MKLSSNYSLDVDSDVSDPELLKKETPPTKKRVKRSPRVISDRNGRVATRTGRSTSTKKPEVMSPESSENESSNGSSMGQGRRKRVSSVRKEDYDDDLIDVVNGGESAEEDDDRIQNRRRPVTRGSRQLNDRRGNAQDEDEEDDDKSDQKNNKSLKEAPAVKQWSRRGLEVLGVFKGHGGSAPVGARTDGLTRTASVKGSCVKPLNKRTELTVINSALQEETEHGNGNTQSGHLNSIAGNDAETSVLEGNNPGESDQSNVVDVVHSNRQVANASTIRISEGIQTEPAESSILNDANASMVTPPVHPSAQDPPRGPLLNEAKDRSEDLSFWLDMVRRGQVDNLKKALELMKERALIRQINANAAMTEAKARAMRGS